MEKTFGNEGDTEKLERQIEELEQQIENLKQNNPIIRIYFGILNRINVERVDHANKDQESEILSSEDIENHPDVKFFQRLNRLRVVLVNSLKK